MSNQIVENIHDAIKVEIIEGIIKIADISDKEKVQRIEYILSLHKETPP